MRKTILSLIFALTGFSLLFTSCDKESVTLTDLEEDYQYYPLSIGKYIVYDVDSLLWNDYLQTIVPVKCQLRYTVVDTFRDASNQLAYVINIQTRKEETHPYVPQDVIYASYHQDKLIVTQQNRKFIKMTFPVEEGNKWNGNSMIPLDDETNIEYHNENWNYVYSDLGVSFQAGARLFQNTVKVTEIDDALNNPDEDSTLFAYRNYSQAIYSKGVGLVYRERIYWTFQPKSPDGKSGGSGYRKGYSVIMRAVDHN